MVTRRSLLKAAVGVSGMVLTVACGSSAAVPQAPTPQAPAQPAPTTVAPATTAPAAASASGAAAPVGALTLDQELAVPPELVEAAQKEGKLVWLSEITKEAADGAAALFGKRYPGIDISYQEASEEQRTVQTLTEYKAGRVSVDMVMGIGGYMAQYKAANALIPLTDLPVFPEFAVPYRDSQGMWIGGRTQFWGIGYYTPNVQPADLPQTWNDLADPKWMGRIGLGDRPQLWLEQRWNEWGPDRTTQWLTAIFANQPQRRKEGLAASINLLGAGEYDLYVPAAPYQVEAVVRSSGSAGWGSPEPLNVAMSEMAILNGCANPNAAKLFVNWFLSQEGNAFYSKAENATPSNPTIRDNPEYLGMFSSSIVGRSQTAAVPEDEQTVLPQITALWGTLWSA